MYVSRGARGINSGRSILLVLYIMYGSSKSFLPTQSFKELPVDHFMFHVLLTFQKRYTSKLYFYRREREQLEKERLENQRLERLRLEQLERERLEREKEERRRLEQLR